MTIWTVSAIDDENQFPAQNFVCGSYTSREAAIDECAEWILERMETRSHLAWSMNNDQNHTEASKFLKEGKLGVTKVRKGMIGKFKDFIMEELGSQGCYYIHDGNDSFHYDIDENDVEGELWHTVTWGDSDCEDVNFTTPWPGTFTSRETAVKTFVDYVRGLFKQLDIDFDRCGTEKSIRDQLDADGKCQVDLDDGCCVSCVLYRGDAKDIKE